MRRFRLVCLITLCWGSPSLAQVNVDRVDEWELIPVVDEDGTPAQQDEPFLGPVPEPEPASQNLTEKKHKNTGFIDPNYYWDTREFTVLTINAGAQLPLDFEYFQFVNMVSPTGSGSGDWQHFYNELHLRRPIAKEHRYLKPLDWTLQYADGTFPQGVLRLGVRWRLQDTPGEFGRFVDEVLKLQFAINFHIIETDGSGWQMEYSYRREFFDKRFYVAGFADHNIDNGSRNSTWVAETQFGLRVVDEWHLVAEYRYNSFEPPGFKSGVGLGVEYVIRFP